MSIFAASNLLWPDTRFVQRWHDRYIVPGLVAVTLLAALGPLLCALICHSMLSSFTPSSRAPLVTNQTTTSTWIQSLPDSPTTPRPTPAHCTLHHSTYQFGPSLTLVSLTPLLLMLLLSAACSPAPSQVALVPIPPPPR
jgi:hypothetical protein